MVTIIGEHPGLPLARRAGLQLVRADDGMWTADDPEVECFATGADPNEAVAALLEAEREYLAILRDEVALGLEAERHREILTARLRD